MKRLVIAIDCDDVLMPCTEYLVHEYNRLYGTQISLEAAHVFSVETMGADREEVHRRLNEIQLSDGYAQVVPYTEAIESVKRLARSHELHMITARPEGIMGVTQRMIEKYFPGYFTSVRHVGPTGSKGDECAALRADVLIDDNIRHLVSAKACGTAIRLWFGHYPWHTEVPEPGIVTARCNDWAEVEAVIAQSSAK